MRTGELRGYTGVTETEFYLKKLRCKKKSYLLNSSNEK